MSDKRSLTDEEKEAEMKRVGGLMAPHTAKHLLGFYHVIEKDYEELEGSGLFLQLGAEPYVLTAAHVCSSRNRLAVYGGPGRPPFLMRNPTQAVGAEIDLALSRLGKEALTQIESRVPLSPARFADDSRADGDFIFVHGFPGVASRFSPSFKAVIAKSLPYTTVLAELPSGLEGEGIRRETHFAIAYQPIGNKDEFDRDAPLPDLHGVSGSAIWATRRNRHPGTEWSVEHAEVIGIAQRWYQDEGCLVALRVEIVREYVRHFLQREAAYFAWRSRGEPFGNDWSDWFKAGEVIAGIL